MGQWCRVNPQYSTTKTSILTLDHIQLMSTVPHGGYVTAVFLQVASTHFSTTLSSQSQPNTIGLHLDFLRRTQSGPALFTVSDIKLGRQTSIVRITLSQDGREEAIASVTQSNLATESGVSFTTKWALHPPPLHVDLKKLEEDKDENWARARAEEMPFPEFRKASQKTQFHYPRHGQIGTAISDQWIRLSTGEKWTNTTLGYVADIFSMPVESHLRKTSPSDPKSKSGEKSQGEAPPAKFWYPTVLLNLDVKKALPEEGVEWLFSRTTTKQIKNGRMDLDIVVLDEEGDIVCLSHHIALAVSSERNVAKRREGESKI